MGFHNEISSSSTSWILQSSSYCSCGKHTGFSHSRCGSCYIIGSYIYTCMLSSVANVDTWKRVTSSTGWCGLCSASGATSLSCAYCQASPAALVPSPSSGVPLSSLNHLIWSNIHGDLNFQSSRLLYYPCFSILREIDLRSRVLVWRSKCEQNNLGWSLWRKQYTTMVYT